MSIELFLSKCEKFLERCEEAGIRELFTRDHSLNGGIVTGIEGRNIEVQARATGAFDGNWENSVRIIGMARGAIGESLSRISGAFAKLRIPEPPVSILVNLAPADLPKDGTWLDLPLAIIILQAAGYLPDLPDHLEGDYILMGELSLHGEVRRVPGALSIAFEAKPGQKLIVPSGNEMECALILAKPGHDGCGVFPVSHLSDVIEFFAGTRTLDNALSRKMIFENAIPKSIDFGKIKGQERAKRAAMISAAGGHNMLLIGPPGEGKTMIASAMAGILPKLRDTEKVQLTKIYSACGALDRDGMAVTRRPFRAIHHTATKQSIIGGGSGVARPGEITLSHLGILFCDEIAEFNGPTLEALRQPMESGEVSISRVRGTMNYPCRFTLIAAMNPCPCGYFGSDECTCKSSSVDKYQRSLSGPILDRIDLKVDIQRLTIEQRFANVSEEPQSPRIRLQVEYARTMQDERYEGTDIPHNAGMPGGHVLEFCQFNENAMNAFKAVIESRSLSTRSMDRLAKISRTIADLERTPDIRPRHVEEAAGFILGGELLSKR